MVNKVKYQDTEAIMEPQEIISQVKKKNKIL